MQGLAERDIVPLWERGASRGALGRARLLLDAACPGSEVEELTVGERDAVLLELRERTLGRHLAGFVSCPECEEPLEVELDASTLRRAAAEAQPHRAELVTESLRAFLRPLTCGDLEAAAATGEPAAARRLLAERCVLELEVDGARVETAALGEDAVAAISERLAECDPAAEVLLQLTCPGCGHAWGALFDIVSFFWGELAAHARRVLHEVASLAGSFGWSERDILELTPARRQHYLALAG